LASKPHGTSPTFAFPQPPLWLLQLVFLGSFAIYTATLNPSLFRNDSPETITACVTLGVSHPPSYPLHTLLGRLFSFIPVGNPAMNLNFFSALLGAFRVFLFALNLWILLSAAAQRGANVKTNRFPLVAACLVGSLSFAFSKSYWSAALAAKGGIYILQILLELGFLFFLQLWIRTRKRQNQFLTEKPLYLSSFIFSLGLTNHWPTQMLLIPAIVLTTFAYLYADGFNAPKNFSLKPILVGFTILFISTSLYLYLPLRSHLYPRLNFGAPFTLHRFIDSLLRIDYSKTETLASFIPTALSTIQEKSFYISNHFIGEFNPAFLLLSIVGVFSLLRRGREYDLVFQLLVLSATLIAGLLYLQVIPIEYWHLDDHLLTTNWVTALLASCGAYSLITFCHNHAARWRGRRVFILGGLIFICLMPIFALLHNLSTNDQRKEFLFHGYGTALLKSMDKNALYFAESDYDYFSLLYLTEVEHKRDDTSLFLTPFLSKDYQAALFQRDPRLKSLVPFSVLSDAVNFQTGFFHWLGMTSIGYPIYCAFPNGPFMEMFLRNNASLSFRPEGFETRLNPLRDALSTNSQIDLLNDFWVHYLTPSNRSTNPINGLFLELCAHPYLNMAHYLMLKKDMTHWNWLYDRALSLISEQPWLAGEWAKRGEGDVLLGDKKEAVGAYEISAFQYLEAGMNEKAALILQKVLTLDPKNPDASQMLTTLHSPGK
jgi:hypothetical protein